VIRRRARIRRRVVERACRPSVVSTAHTLVVMRTIIPSPRRRNRRSRVRSVMTRAHVVSGSSMAARGSRKSGDLRVVSETTLALVALPELHAGAFGVAV